MREKLLGDRNQQKHAVGRIQPQGTKVMSKGDVVHGSFSRGDLFSIIIYPCPIISSYGSGSSPMLWKQCGIYPLSNMFPIIVECPTMRFLWLKQTYPGGSSIKLISWQHERKVRVQHQTPVLCVWFFVRIRCVALDVEKWRKRNDRSSSFRAEWNEFLPCIFYDLVRLAF